MASSILPTALFEGLLLKLVTVLELTRRPEGMATPQAKQALLQATNDFKNTLNKAKELVNLLPGGEMLVEEQDEIIDMLEKLRDHKQQQLSQFSTCILSFSGGSVNGDVKMEVDSMASTPLAS
ncbi:hypothetical protein PILCRDRAFT_821099 [Piloderma croceum F 1598]|uniref:Mediator of RNA polymerase II transcription subunit 9 n=1 Tax=Piloderma croceum (strain F 1598) TaxID=765440 RepID=A0A0C3FAS5_PILCF|nr:hypothetical protein PILCRDRAFT_821099 [Piloderma croceum F 1598]